MGRKNRVIDEYEEKQKELMDSLYKEEVIETVVEEDTAFQIYMSVNNIRELLNDYRKEMALPLCEYLSTELLQEFIFTHC